MSQLGTSRRRVLGALGGVAATAVLGVAVAAAPAQAAGGTVIGAGRADAVAGSYIVVLKDGAASADAVRSAAASLAGRHAASVDHVYTAAVRGFAARMSDREARRLAANPAVAYVEQNTTVHAVGTQANPPSWGLDRIDQRNRPLNSSYTYPNTASNVHAYIIDTGIRFAHTDFGGRATSGFDAVDGGSADDGNGHGTHVAGTVGGTSFGVAKGVQLVAVRVLNNSGSGTTAGVIAGVDWVTNNAIKPAVANMSLGGGIQSTLDTAVANSISSGVTYAVAAGNSNANACNFSPARVASAITVGATDINDNRASFSNFGSCLDLFAPGVSITSAWFTSNTATNTISGTSMASPHAAGVAALIASANPTWTPSQVRNEMVADATSGVVGNPATGSPNLLLFVDNGTTPPGTTVYSDTFETATGWTTNPNGTDTATTGQWVRGDPAGTSSGGVTLQLGTTVSGTNDLVTGASAGTGAGDFDVDNGVTSVQSPAITLPTSGTLTLRFSWYLAHLTNATSADYFRAFVNGSQVFQQVGSATNRAGAWATASVNLSGLAGQTIRIRFDTADASTASLIEAGVDNVTITRS